MPREPPRSFVDRGGFRGLLPLPPYTTIPLGLLMGRAGASDISLEDVGQITQSVIRKMGQSG